MGKTRKVLIGAAFFVLALAALRRFGPALHNRAMTKCREMFERMSEDAPPERMLNGFEEERTALPAARG